MKHLSKFQKKGIDIMSDVNKILSNQKASFEEEGFTYTEDELRYIKELLQSDKTWDEQIQEIIKRSHNNGV